MNETRLRFMLNLRNILGLTANESGGSPTLVSPQDMVDAIAAHLGTVSVVFPNGSPTENVLLRSAKDS
jgi:hypothetical protein